MDVRRFVGIKGIAAEYISLAIHNYGTEQATITYDRAEDYGSAMAGSAVKFGDDGAIDLAEDGDEIAGLLVLVESDGWATVQVAGGAIFRAGGTVTAGSRVVAGTDGGVKDAAQAIETDELTGAVGKGMIVDASDEDAVQVWL